LESLAEVVGQVFQQALDIEELGVEISGERARVGREYRQICDLSDLPLPARREVDGASIPFPRLDSL